MIILSLEGRGYGDLGAQRLSRSWRGWSGFGFGAQDPLPARPRRAESPSPLKGEGR